MKAAEAKKVDESIEEAVVRCTCKQVIEVLRFEESGPPVNPCGKVFSAFVTSNGAT